MAKIPLTMFRNMQSVRMACSESMKIVSMLSTLTLIPASACVLG